MEMLRASTAPGTLVDKQCLVLGEKLKLSCAPRIGTSGFQEGRRRAVLVVSASGGRGPDHQRDVRRAAAISELSLSVASEPAADQGQAAARTSFSAGAEARLLAVVGRGKLSPWGKASWKEVLEQMARKLTRVDSGMEMVVLDDGEVMNLDAGHEAVFREADILVTVNVEGAASAAHIMSEASHLGTLVAFDSHPELSSRLNGVRVVPLTFFESVEAALPLTKMNEAEKQLQMVREVWERVSSDNILVALQMLINNYVTPVKSLQKLQAKGLGFLRCAVGNCGPQLVACLLDSEAREALTCMQACDPTDQFCTYRCIACHENPNLQALSLCLLEQHNCLDLCAAVPMNLAVEPIQSFRGEPTTHQMAENLLIGWSRELGFSWRIAANMFPIASQFRSQTQTFYREADGCMWYDPVFQVTGKDGEALWRRRHYSVDRAEQPGSFAFAFLDNGVMTREYWVIVDVAEDLSWALFHSVGAAQRTGQTFTGAVVCTPTGQWPADSSDLERLYRALDKCDIKDWETVRVDHSSYAGAPRLAPPEHVPAQAFLG